MSKVKNAFKWLKARSTATKIATIILLGVASYFTYTTFLNKNNKQQLTTERVKRTTIIDTVSESGNVQSNQLTVYSVSNGVIEALYVKNGQTVQKGDKLFRVRSTASDQDKAEAWANYRSAILSKKNSEQDKTSADASILQKQKSVEDAQNDVNYKNGHDEKPGTSKNYTNLEKKSLDTALTQAKKELSAAEQKYSDSDIAISSANAQVSAAFIKYQTTQDVVITAKVSGVIANLSYSVGDQVTAALTTSGSNTGTTASSVLVIGTDTENIVKIQINEVDINKIKVGQEATITIDAIKNKTFKAEVTRVDDYGTNTSGVITYNVYVKITDLDEQIKPLMSAVVSIQTAIHNDALVVPNISVKPYKGGKAVQVVDENNPSQLKYIQVKTGIKTIKQTEILEGVSEGMEVVNIVAAPTASKSESIIGGP